MALFEKEDTNKTKDVLEVLEEGKNYALIRRFLLPYELDRISEKGWDLIAFGTSQGKYGYYFIKR